MLSLFISVQKNLINGEWGHNYVEYMLQIISVMSSDSLTSNLRSGGYNIYTVITLVRNPGGQFGGYKTCCFMNPVEQQCAFCRQIPRDPYRVSCGHLFCQDCLFKHFIDLRQPCNQCNTPIRRDDCVSDPQLTKLIADSSIYCPFSDKCQWAGPLSSLSLHFSECTQINPLTRSWMQSIQSHLSNLAGESGRLERRVDRLSELVKKMDSGCEAATYEYEKQLGWIGNQMNGIQEALGTFPGNEFTEPTPVPRFLKPPHLGDYPSLNIDEAHMTESLRHDLGRNSDLLPKRKFRFSVYEDHVREDTGDLDFELNPDPDPDPDLDLDLDLDPDLEEIEVFVHDGTGYVPNMLNENVKCLNCHQMTPATSSICQFCKKFL